jgi:NADH-quinone oxidoreductase subunit F
LIEPILLTNGPDASPQTLDEYRAEGGYEALATAVAANPQLVLDEIVASGLRGRGGAGFPTGQKWSLTAQEQRTPKFVVANGGEDEPGSQKDRVLMERYPHKIIEGTLLGAHAIGAGEVILYVNSLYDVAIAQLETAIVEATEAGHLGTTSIRVAPAPQQYVAGEDTAALEVIEGRDPLPRAKPPFPTSTGLYGQPTIVNNIETFALAPAIVRHGAEWFRSQGTADNPGTMLFTLPENVRHPGVVELPIGTTLRELIDVHGGGLISGKTVKGVLPGGPSSGWVNDAELDVALDRGPLKALGSSLGCGALRILEEGECVAEACGQCPACNMETQTLAKIISQVKSGHGMPQLIDQIPQLAAFAAGKGFCSLITMPIAPLTSAARLYPQDIAHHLAHGTCPEVPS